MEKPKITIVCDADGIRVSDGGGEFYTCGFKQADAIHDLLQALAKKGYIEPIDETPEEEA